MADQAVDIFFIAEIKIRVIPAITGMARRAGCPVALDTDAEVVDGVLFAGCEKTFTSFNFDRFGFPSPMCGFQHLLTGIFVTDQDRQSSLPARWSIQQTLSNRFL